MFTEYSPKMSRSNAPPAGGRAALSRPQRAFGLLGRESFARSLKPGLRMKEREQRQARQLAPAVAWPEIVSALEHARGEKWAEFSARRGDWGRDAALWLGRRQGRLSLSRLGELAGGTDYAAVSVAVRRFAQRLAGDAKLRRQLGEIEREMLNVDMTLVLTCS